MSSIIFPALHFLFWVKGEVVPISTSEALIVGKGYQLLWTRNKQSCQLTCSFTAMTTEFRSLSISFSMTSFFRVKLNSLDKFREKIQSDVRNSWEKSLTFCWRNTTLSEVRMSECRSQSTLCLPLVNEQLPLLFNCCTGEMSNRHIIPLTSGYPFTSSPNQHVWYWKNRKQAQWNRPEHPETIPQLYRNLT